MANLLEVLAKLQKGEGKFEFSDSGLKVRAPIGLLSSQDVATLEANLELLKELLPRNSSCLPAKLASELLREANRDLSAKKPEGYHLSQDGELWDEILGELSLSLETGREPSQAISRYRDRAESLFELFEERVAIQSENETRQHGATDFP